MKKLSSIILILAITACMLAPFTLAQDQHPELESAILIGDWDDAQWEQALMWPDEDWFAYIAWEQELYETDEDAYWVYINSVWMAMEEWTEEQYEAYWRASEVYWDYIEAIEKIERKKNLGFPHTEGYNLRIDDSFITFEDIRPVKVGRDYFIPLRAFFENIGAKVAYNNDTRSAVIGLAGGEIITADFANDRFTWGEDGEKVVDADSLYYYSRDTGIFIEEADRMLVDTAALSKVLDYRYDFYTDYDNDVIMAINTDAIIEKIDKEFTVLDRLFKQEPQFGQEKEKLEFQAGIEATLYGQDDNITAGLGLEGQAIMAGRDANLSARFNVDINQLDFLFQEYDMYNEFAFLYGLDGEGLDLILDSGKDQIYVKSGLLKMIHPAIGDNVWLSVPGNIEELYDDILDTGYDSIGDMIYWSYLTNFYYYTYDEDYLLYENMLMGIKLFSSIAGDSAFTVTQKDGRTAFELKGGLNSITSAASKLGIDSYTLHRIFNYSLYDFRSLEYAVCLAETDGRFTDISLKVSGGLTLFTMEIDCELRDGSADLYMGIIGDLLGKVTVKASLTAEPTDEALVLIPDGDVITEEDLDYFPDTNDDYDFDQLYYMVSSLIGGLR